MGRFYVLSFFSEQDEFYGYIFWIIMPNNVPSIYCKNWEDPKFRHLGNYTSTTRSSNPCLATTCLIECGNWRRMPDQRYNSWGKCHLLGYVFLALWIYNQTGYTHSCWRMHTRSKLLKLMKDEKNHLQFLASYLYVVVVPYDCQWQ
jgi:hypothetical protein